MKRLDIVKLFSKIQIQKNKQEANEETYDQKNYQNATYIYLQRSSST